VEPDRNANCDSLNTGFNTVSRLMVNVLSGNHSICVDQSLHLDEILNVLTVICLEVHIFVVLINISEKRSDFTMC